MVTYDQIILPLGHHEMVQRMDDVDVELMDGVLVKLVASVEAHPAAPPGPGKHRGATTLAIRMDRVVATLLAQRILELAQTMGWPLPPKGESQA